MKVTLILSYCSCRVIFTFVPDEGVNQGLHVWCKFCISNRYKPKKYPNVIGTLLPPKYLNGRMDSNISVPNNRLALVRSESRKLQKWVRVTQNAVQLATSVLIFLFCCSCLFCVHNKLSARHLCTFRAISTTPFITTQRNDNNKVKEGAPIT